MAIKSVKDLKVYNEAFGAAMDVFKVSRKFPSEEKFSLTSQLVRSSRSIAANIREGFAKRHYDQVFIKHLIDALGSSEESETWLDFAFECNYLGEPEYKQLSKRFHEISSMLYSLQKNWKSYH